MKSLLKFNAPFRLLDNRPPLVAGVSYFLIAFLVVLSSCSSFIIPLRSSRDARLVDDKFQDMGAKDYSDHLASLRKPFLSTPGIKIFPLNDQAQKYLKSVTSQIILNNEIFFKTLKDARITIIDNDAPLHFSLSQGEIFLSKGLIVKYVKHESMLVSILAYELVRSEKLLYPKLTFVPVGFVPLEQMLLLGRLNLEEKMEVHKWAHHITLRSGYDGEYYLSWLQVQNRNTADFLLQVGDANLISREESLFKAFLIKNANEEHVAPRSASKSFYTFLNKIRDGVL